uniref:Uncharacterized protein n=1 Tax=Ectocarpus siliculosus TaxID=2880 RepID=A0A5K1KEM9_ECTSI|nr:Conserved mitochondrial hypothetical protein [Ectocarpus siliculosus]
MFTPRKRHLRKKRFFLSKQKTFALFNASNLKTSKITEIRLSLKNAKLYFIPLYLNPPKLGTGYPLIIVIYNKLENMQKNIPTIASKIDCIGVSIEKKWYPIKIFENNNLKKLDKKILGLLLLQINKIK